MTARREPAAVANQQRQGASCPVCGYDVSSITGARCPECGLDFDGPIRHVVGWMTTSRRRMRRLALLNLIVVLGGWLLWALAATPFLRSHKPNYLHAIVGGAPLIACALAGLLVSRTLRRELRAPFERTWRATHAWLYAPAIAGLLLPLVVQSIYQYVGSGLPSGDRRWNDAFDTAIGWGLRIHIFLIPAIAASLWFWHWWRETRRIGAFRKALLVRAAIAGSLALVASTLPALAMWFLVLARAT